MSRETLNNKWLMIEVESQGAELVRMVSMQQKHEIELLWDGNPKYWTGRSPLLFPIVGKVKDDSLLIGEKTYKLIKHGFARHSEFHCIEKTADRLVYSLKATEASKKFYPYEFELQVSYKFELDALAVQWVVFNYGEEMMYFSIGAHPALRMPHNNNAELAEYSLVLHGDQEICEYSLNPPYISAETWKKRPDKLVMGPALFAEDTLLYAGVKGVSLMNETTNSGIMVECNEFPYVAIWSPVCDSGTNLAPFVCIEPWFGLPDYDTDCRHIEQKRGMQSLKAGASFRTEYRIRFINGRK